MKLLRNKLFWVAVVCAAPILLGTAAYLSGWSPGGASNYGELLDPKPLSGFGPLRGKWVLVSFDAAACDAYCEKKLYFMRQVRRAQGKDMDRVERLWVVTDGGKPRPELLPGIEGTRLANLPAKQFPGNAFDHIYIVDPFGNLMLRFPRDPDPSKIIKDVQRLLKYTARPR
ncbi:MAG TPA: cytochrome C oxidase subunit I [Burkholderiales bacterium]|nr:cytochrome C oxidase subunit I [Burkholderiales bacterium]